MTKHCMVVKVAALIGLQLGLGNSMLAAQNGISHPVSVQHPVVFDASPSVRQLAESSIDPKQKDRMQDLESSSPDSYRGSRILTSLQRAVPAKSASEPKVTHIRRVLQLI